MFARARAPVLALGALLVATGCPSGDPDGVAPGPPNIVLLLSDDHGYPDYGFMGSPVVETPRLDGLAEQGVVFTHGYSTASVCRPALATLLTGLEPLQLLSWEREWARGRRGAGKRPAAESFIASLETLPRVLASHGYATFQAGKYWEGPYWDAGFAEGMVDTAERGGRSRRWRELVRSTLEPAYDFVEQNADRPFFLWFAPQLPHLPHDAPEPYRRLYDGVEGPAADYYAAVSWLDDGIGRLVDRIRALGLERRTLFVYLADNGWDPGSDGATSLGGPKGKMSLYELGFRTPVILRWLGGIEPRPARSELLSLTDVFATLLDYAGASSPPHRHGHSLRPLLEGRAPWPRQDIVGWMSHLRGQHKGSERGGSFWRGARWHYLQPVGASPLLFDLVADPLEDTDVSADHPAVVARARERLEQWTRSLHLHRR